MNVQVRDHIWRPSGAKIDASANLSSVISESQYLSYCDEFCVHPIIREADDRWLRGICGEVKPIGILELQIPFNYMQVTISVDVLALKGDLLTLMGLRDLI